MKKENFINRLLHYKELLEQRGAYESSKRIIMYYNFIIKELNECNSLIEVMKVHKTAWALGFQNENICPNAHGIFRCSNILDMTPDDVYLGNIWGLNTHNITFFIEYNEETMAGNGFGIDPNTKVYELVLDQYKKILKSNFSVIFQNASNFFVKFNEL